MPAASLMAKNTEMLLLRALEQAFSSSSGLDTLVLEGVVLTGYFFMGSFSLFLGRRPLLSALRIIPVLRVCPGLVGTEKS